MLLYNLKTKLKKEPQKFLLILLNWSLSFLICIQPVSKPICSINQHCLFLSLPVLQSQHGTRSYPCTHSDLHIITDNVDIEYRLVRSFAASIKIWGLSKENQNILLFTVSREIHESMTWESWVHVMFVAIRFFGCFFFCERSFQVCLQCFHLVSPKCWCCPFEYGIAGIEGKRV